MMLTRHTRTGLTFLATALLWPCVLVADTPLAAIPTETGFMVRAAHPGPSVEKLKEFVSDSHAQDRPADPNDSSLMGMWIGLTWADLLKAFSNNIDQEDEHGVDDKRSWWVFGWNLQGPDACYVTILPANDPDAYQANLTRNKEQNNESTFDSVVYQSWVICGTTPAIDAVKKCISGEKPSVESRMEAESLATFNQGDIGIFIDFRAFIPAEFNEDAIKDGIRELVAGFVEFLTDDFGEIVEIAPWPQEFTQVWVLFTNQVVDGLAQWVVDAERLTLSLTIDQDAIQLENFVTVKAESKTAAFFQNNPGSEMGVLSSLPVSSGIYVGMHFNWKDTLDWTWAFLRSANEAGVEVKVSEAHEALRKKSQQLNFGTVATAYPMHPIDQGLLRSLTIKEVDAPELARDLANKQSDIPPIVLASAEIKPPDPVRTTEKYGPLSVDVVTYSEEGLGENNAADATNLNPFLFGSDVYTIRTAYLNDRIVESVGGSKVRTAAAFRQIAESLETAVPQDAEFTKTRQRLDQSANLILMVDVGAATSAGMRLWNSCIESFMPEEEVPMVMMNRVVEMDEGKPALDDAAVPVQEKEGENVAEKPVDDEVAADNVGIQRIGVDFDFNIEPKFGTEEIEKLGAVRSLIGCSLKLEPTASRVRIVIPRPALKSIVEASEIIWRKMGLGVEEAEIQILRVNENGEIDE